MQFMETTTIKIEGMTCGGCVASVERLLRAVAGVQNVEVSLTPGLAKIGYEPAVTSVEQLKQAVREAGFNA